MHQDSLEVLSQVSKSLTSELNLDKLVQAATDAGRQMTGAQFGAFFYYREDAKEEPFILGTSFGAPREAFSHFPAAFFEMALKKEGIVRVADMIKNPPQKAGLAACDKPEGCLPVRSYMAAPVVSRSGEILGGLFFGHSIPNAFNERAEQALTAIAGQASVALDNAHLYRTVLSELAAHRRVAEELRASEESLAAELRGITSLYEVGSQCVNPESDFTKCLESILDAAISILGADKGNLQLADAVGKLKIKAQRGFGEPFPSFFDSLELQYPSVCAMALRAGQRMLVEDLTNSELLTEGSAKEVLLAAGVRALQSTPLVAVGGKSLGVISTHFARPHTPAERELKLLDLLARQAADYIERQRTEEMSARLAAIVDHSHDAIVSKDLSGTIKTWNQGAERIFGYTAVEAVGKAVSLLIPPERANEEPDILRRIRQGERIDHYETVRRRKDGALLDISLTVSPIKDARGQIIGASKIARDITERKRAEAALRRSESLFRELADSMPQIVWAALPDGSVDYYNRRWYEYTGFPHGEINEGSAERILHPDDLPRWRDIYFTSIRQERPFQIEYRFKDHRTDGYRWFLGRAEPIRDETGKLIRWFGTWTDIDDQKRAAERLEKTVAERTASLRAAMAQMEEFSYTVSHDLRAPLRAMQGYSQTLQQDYAALLPPEAQHAVTRIAENAAQLDKMIVDILTYSKIARSEFRLEKVKLDDLVRQMVGQHPEMRLPAAEIHIDPLPDVMGHESSLSQVVANLLNNALKFVAPKVTPKVHIWAQNGNGRVRLWIEDNGIGIAPEFQPKVFNMFERAHPHLKYEGTGIGLAIVRKGAERMGGAVGVESDGVHGSRFWIELPALNCGP